MIKSKKRPAEKAVSGDGPDKNKSPKLDTKSKRGPSSADLSKKVKFSKDTKPQNFVKKPAGTASGPGKSPKGKFTPSLAGKFAPKVGGGKSGAGKYVNKFAGKPKFSAKQGEKEDPSSSEKTDWRQFKQDKKDLKLKRKKAKDSYEVSIEAKQIYEKLKCRRTEKRSELVEKLYNLLSGGDTIKKLVMAHDTARIIQCMLKLATPSIRDQLSERLLPLSVEMAVSKYSHFCVLRMFKYGSPAIKSKLVDSFFGNMVKLACHNISSKILDHVYLSVADGKQKIHMRQEFYGELYRKAKDISVKQLSDTYKDTPNMKASVLGSVKSNLEHVANKELVDNSLVHAVMLEYLRECDEEKMEETITMFATLIPLMLTTKDGCQASIICFYKATPKNRRAIIKTIKEHLVKICTHEHGHIFMLAMLNSLDDTKATKKAIYDNIHPELQTLMSNQWGRRVVEWLISPADTNCFHPTFIASIEEGLQYGKKDKAVRRKEIFEQIEEPIANAMVEKPDFWFSDKHIGLVTAEILKKLSQANFVKAATALAAIIANPDWTVAVVDESTKDKKSKKVHDVEKIIADATKLKKKNKAKAAKATTADEEQQSDDDDDDDDKKEEVEPIVSTTTVSGIEEAGMHIILKKIIKSDKERLAQNASAETFGTILLEQLSEDTLKYWFTVNRACFVLLNLVENNNDSTTQALKKLTKSHQSTLKKQTASGSKLLLKKLSL